MMVILYYWQVFNAIHIDRAETNTQIKIWTFAPSSYWYLNILNIDITYKVYLTFFLKYHLKR
jgi:hypothetical protein